MPVWLHLKPEQFGKSQEKKKINIVVLFRSYPTRNRKFQKNSKKIQKKLKNNIIAPLKEDEKGGQEKLSFRSVPTQRRIENA